MKLSKLLTWRTARWAVLAAAVPALWACNARRLEAPQPKPARVFNGLFQQVLRSALADAHDSSVSLDGDDHVALIE